MAVLVERRRFAPHESIAQRWKKSRALPAIVQQLKRRDERATLQPTY
ncbi:hypothetical protein [Bradyrhizobium sp. 141]|nr:hypothetical protein [Bradyrhizobium sp. 141]MCK1721070.1 hypothetical protein [Bradyrhizobium sp. 141]